jgi:hypothetical protein
MTFPGNLSLPMIILGALRGDIPSRLNDTPFKELLIINRPEEKINLRRARTDINGRLMTDAALN